MNILFENKYIRDKKMFQEVYKKTFLNNPVTIILFLCFAGGLLSYILMLVMGDPILFIDDWTLPLCWVLVVLLRIFSYFQSVKLAVKRDVETFGGAPTIEIKVTDEGVYHSVNGSEVQLQYAYIKKAFVTKNYIIIKSMTDIMYIFERNSFTVGAADDFITFLKSRSIKVK